jgi:hypothetical protein
MGAWRCGLREFGNGSSFSESVYLGRDQSLFETKGMVFTKHEAEKQHFSKTPIENLDVAIAEFVQSNGLPHLPCKEY